MSVTISRLALVTAVILLVPAQISGSPQGKKSGSTSSRRFSTTVRPSEKKDDDSAIHGFTEPYRDIAMSAAEMGTLAEINVSEGDEVKAGQLIGRLDSTVLEASLKVADAGRKATGELEAAKAQLEIREQEHRRISRLFEQQFASQREMDRVQSDLKVARTRLQTATEDLQIRALEYERIRAQLKQREVRSTIDGIVMNVNRDVGEFVSPSDPVVARVVTLDPILVVFSVPAERRDEVTRGETVNISISGNGSTVGEVEFVSPSADPSSRRFRVKVKVANPEAKWHGGEKTVLLLDTNSKNTRFAKKSK